MNKIYPTYRKCNPPQINSVSWWQKREKPSRVRLFSRMMQSMRLLRQLIRCTSLTNLPHLSVPPTTNIESLILAARWPVLPGNSAGVACTALFFDEKFISILNITIHEINNQYISQHHHHHLPHFFTPTTLTPPHPFRPQHTRDME